MDAALFLVYFVYGLAFLAMGLAMLLETGRARTPAQARELGCLAAFGIIHGSHEWLEAYLLQAPAVGVLVPAGIDWLRVVLLVVSFGFLAGYSALSLARSMPLGAQLATLAALPPVLAIAALLTSILSLHADPVPWADVVDALSRYALAVPSAWLAAVALWAGSLTEKSRGSVLPAVSLRAAAVGLAFYAASQIFVRPLAMFPAEYINQASFLQLTGLPIQVVRAVAAILIAYGLMRAAHAVEEERQHQLGAALRSRLQAVEQRDALRRELLRHIVRSQEDERARVARELHDDVAQLLSALSLELATLRAELGASPTSGIVERLQGSVRNVSQALYRLMRDLRPPQLDNLGLVAALEALVQQDCMPKGLDVVLTVRGSPRQVDSLVETALYRVAQEALVNVARHANVSAARMELEYAPGSVRLRISDAGCGFDPAQQFNPPRGWGLAGMRERLESVEGSLRVHSTAGGGTTVEAVVELREGVEREATNGIHQVALGG